jgi:chemosensory pili system protein ChpA (sensor histidine kinase/response regulator)
VEAAAVEAAAEVDGGGRDCGGAEEGLVAWRGLAAAEAAAAAAAAKEAAAAAAAKEAAAAAAASAEGVHA